MRDCFTFCHIAIFIFRCVVRKTRKRSTCIAIVFGRQENRAPSKPEREHKINKWTDSLFVIFAEYIVLYYDRNPELSNILNAKAYTYFLKYLVQYV